MPSYCCRSCRKVKRLPKNPIKCGECHNNYCKDCWTNCHTVDECRRLYNPTIFESHLGYWDNRFDSEMGMDFKRWFEHSSKKMGVECIQMGIYFAKIDGNIEKVERLTQLCLTNGFDPSWHSRCHKVYPPSPPEVINDIP